MTETREKYHAGPDRPAPSAAYTAIKRAAESWCKTSYDHIHPASAVSVEIADIDAYNGKLWATVRCHIESDPNPVYVAVEARFTVTDVRPADD